MSRQHVEICFMDPALSPSGPSGECLMGKACKHLSLHPIEFIELRFCKCCGSIQMGVPGVTRAGNDFSLLLML